MAEDNTVIHMLIQNKSEYMAIPPLEVMECLMNIILEEGYFSPLWESAIEATWGNLNFAVDLESFVSLEEREIFEEFFVDETMNPYFRFDENRRRFVSYSHKLHLLSCFVYHCLDFTDYRISLNKHRAARNVWDWINSDMMMKKNLPIPKAFFERVRRLENLMDSAE